MYTKRSIYKLFEIWFPSGSLLDDSLLWWKSLFHSILEKYQFYWIFYNRKLGWASYYSLPAVVHLVELGKNITIANMYTQTRRDGRTVCLTLSLNFMHVWLNKCECIILLGEKGSLVRVMTRHTPMVLFSDVVAFYCTKVHRLFPTMIIL